NDASFSQRTDTRIELRERNVEHLGDLFLCEPFDFCHSTRLFFHGSCSFLAELGVSVCWLVWLCRLSLSGKNRSVENYSIIQTSSQIRTLLMVPFARLV